MRRWPAALMLVALGACSDPVRVEHAWTALGREATAEIHATSARIAEEIVEEMVQATRRVEAAVDPANPDSELAKLNRKATAEPVAIEDPDLYIAIKHALDYAKASGGAFDPTAGPLIDVYAAAAAERAWPDDETIEQAVSRVRWTEVTLFPEAHAIRLRMPGMQLDMATMADGMVLDAAARAFARLGSRAGLLRLGHTLQAWGQPLDREVWRVPLPDPRERGRLLGWVSVDNRGVGVTAAPLVSRPEDVLSGRVVLDPRTGRPTTTDVRAAVAIAEGAADAAALSSALLVGGSLRAGALLGKTYRVEALLIVSGSGRPHVLASSSLRGRFEPSPELEREAQGNVRYILPPETVELPAIGFGRR